MAKGNYTNAYLTKQPSPVDPSAWINQQEQMNLYYDQLANKKKAEQQARKDKERELFNKDLQEFDLSSMGNDIVNGIFLPLANESIKELNDTESEMEKALNDKGYNSPEYSALKRKYDNILMRPKKFRLAMEGAATSLNDYKDLVAKGEILQTPENLQKLDRFSGKVKVTKDGDGNYLFGFGKDENADGIDDIYRLEDIAKGLDLGKLVAKVDEDEILKGITSSFKKKEYEQRIGFDINTVTNPWEDYSAGGNDYMGVKKLLSNGIDNKLKNEDAVESIAYGRGIDYRKLPEKSENPQDLTKEAFREMLKEDWMKEGRGQIEEGWQTKFDSGRATNSREWSKINNANKKDESEPSLKSFPVTVADFGAYEKDVDKTKYQGVNVPMKKLSSNSKPVKLTLEAPVYGQETNFLVDKFTVRHNPDSKKDEIVVSGSYIDDKGATNQVGEDEDGNPIKVKPSETRQRSEIRLTESEATQLGDWIGQDPFQAAKKTEGQTTDEKPTTSDKADVL